VELSPAQQERYARHLILDRFGGEGQERLLAASVEVRGTGAAALWAARYLAASGVGRLAVEVPRWHEELQALGPWMTLGAPGVHLVHRVAPKDGASPAESAMNGAQAAVDAVRAIARGTA
jgi:hypothetical protein